MSAATTTVSGPLVESTKNPRYFTATSGDCAGRAVYLTGSHIWNNLHDGMGPGPEGPAEPERSTTTSTCVNGISASSIDDPGDLDPDTGVSPFEASEPGYIGLASPWPTEPAVLPRPVARRSG